MRVAGLVVEIARRPSASVVVLEGSFRDPNIVEIFHLTTTGNDTAQQAHDMATNLRNRLHGLQIDRVIVRKADRPPRPSNKEGPRLRLVVEGALIGAAKDVVDHSEIINGRDAAGRVGISKSALDAAGRELSGEESQAAAAALAAFA